MNIEILHQDNLKALTSMCMELFPDADYEEELHAFERMLGSAKDTCFLLKLQNDYAGFIHVSLRYDYVEGSETEPTAYVEALFVKPCFRRQGFARLLLKEAENWAVKNNVYFLGSDCTLDNTGSVKLHLNAGFQEANRVVSFIKKLA